MSTALGNAVSPPAEFARQREFSVVRGPAFRVIAECLRLAAASPRPSRLAMLFGTNPLPQDARGWYHGAIGELGVTRALQDLGSEWVVLHPTRDAEAQVGADYLLVGAPGVFSIVIKDHTDQRVRVDGSELTVNGRRTNHLSDARIDAVRLARALDVNAVSPLVVIVNPRSLQRAAASSKEALRNEPTVAGSSHLTAFLAELVKRHSSVLDRSAISSAVGNAERGGAWKSAAAVHDQTLMHADRFDRLRLDVERASRRRVIWVAAAAVATVAGIAVLLFPGFG